jgi:trimeric autotransporter adhesin
MFQSSRKSPRKITDSLVTNDRYTNYLARSIIILGLVAVGNPLGLAPLLAAPTPANTTIENQATGSFTDGEDPVATPELIISNVVKVTVAEVAGITVSAGTASEAPASVATPGALQGDGTINVGDIVYFDYVITNAGNDPTQFFIPDAPSSITGGTFDRSNNPIQVIYYNPTGTTNIAPATSVTVPSGGLRTGPSTSTATTGGLLGLNGIIPAGGTITIRVPIKVATNATTVSATMGNTPTPLGSNQVYSNNNNLDIYTQDNPDGTINGTIVETAGIPINGDGTLGDNDDTKHRQESSNIGSATVVGEPINISGTVFEDVNYGGGAGRSLTGATGIVRQNVRVEIYAANGTYLGATLTDASGTYKFNQLNATTAFTASKSYQIRVVNSFVTSSRTGGCNATTATITTPPTSCTQIPVQTFRTSGDTDSNNIADADPTRVGGELPARMDAVANTTSQNISALTSGNDAVASLTTVALGTAAMSGVDFGYNFDTIVNTNNLGQGSLRQFITNSNALDNTGLAQVGQTAGKEVSIFMIPGQAGLGLNVPTTTATAGIRAGVPNQLTNGVGIITATTVLPQISDANTSIDGSTQTTDVGDTNTGTLGYAGRVGTGADGVSGNSDDPVLTAIEKPEIEIQGIIGDVLNINAVSAIVRGIAIRGTNSNSIPTGIRVQPGANSFLVENSIIGSGASTFVDPGASNRLAEAIVSLGATSNVIIRNNLIGYVGSFGIDSSSPNLLVERNRFAEVGRDLLLINSYSEQMRFSGNGPATIKENYFGSTVVSQIDLGSGHNVVVENNTLTNGHSVNTNDSYENAAIHARSGADLITISHNIISNTQNNGHGIMVQSSSYGTAANRVTITQNSIFNNNKLGINLNPTGLVPTGTNDGVTPNNGLIDPTGGNNGMDYPILISSSVSVNASISTLSVKGYVGNLPAGSTTFADAKIEFFVGAADTNDKGLVFSSDPATVSKLHAEGQTYLGTCTADANGLFGTVAKPCAFTVPTGTDPRNITSTATDPLGNTSEFSAAMASDPNVLLVKRITAINGLTQQPDGSLLNTYVHFNTYDDNTISIPTQAAASDPQKDTDKWPNAASGFLLGAVDGGNVAPNSSIEYTIYFLSTGESEAKNVLFCDRVPSNVTFIPTAFNSLPTSSGIASDRGIAVNIGGTVKGYSNSADSDFAQYFPPGVEPSTVYPNIKCSKAGTNLPNDNGAVVVNLGNIPQATSSGVPPESYGFVRFQGRVK